METYPYTFEPIYVEKIWGGRNLERIFGRALPVGSKIGESWELADLDQGVSVVANGPEAGTTLTELTQRLGGELLGDASAVDGRFPLLLKLLDANDILSLQVHPDAAAVEEIGPAAALKTECWYVLESRGGYIYKGVKGGVQAQQFRKAIDNDTVEQFVERFDVAAGDFHYLPAGTVHALGAGVVVAEVQTPSDTTYRVTDWGRGREIHVDRSMQCIHFEPPAEAPGANGQTLLVTDFFTVARRSVSGSSQSLPAGQCAAIMILGASGDSRIRCASQVEPVVPVTAGQTVLLPAALKETCLESDGECTWLEVTLGQSS